MLIMEENTYNRLVAVQGLGSITPAVETNELFGAYVGAAAEFYGKDFAII